MKRPAATALVVITVATGAFGCGQGVTPAATHNPLVGTVKAAASYMVRIIFYRGLHIRVGAEVRIKIAGKVYRHAGRVVRVMGNQTRTTVGVALKVRFAPLHTTATATVRTAPPPGAGYVLIVEPSEITQVVPSGGFIVVH